MPITTGSAACVTVGAGSIGDFVWRDWNGNGMQDAGEEGIPGVTVKLYVDDGDGIFEPGAGDTLSQTDMTDANGIYGFTGLGGGSYWVAIDSGVPAGYVLTGDPQGALDGRALVVLPTNGATSDIDFGYQPAGTAAINGNAYEDSNDTAANNFEPADSRIADVTVNLYEDTDGDGILGPGDLLIATDVTDANGFYEFTGLASGLSYLVDIVQTDPDLAGHFAPDAYAAVPGADGVDPRPVPNLSGASTQDFGYDRIIPSSIGDEVFIDLDGSGTFNAGDTPLANVTVTLYQDLNGNGVVDGSEAATAVTTVSDATGKYLFDGLVPGDYIVVVDTQDADIPAGLAAQVSQYVIDLPAGTAYLTADFPFESLMTKTVNLATATAGQTLEYTHPAQVPGA